MECYLIYYCSKKTALCEKAVKTELKSCGVEIIKTLGAADPLYLGNMLTDGLNHCGVVITIGGLNSFKTDSLEKILSSAIEKSGVTIENVRKLPLDIEQDKFGYLIEKGNQCIIALPDNPEEISELFENFLSNYFEDKIKTDK